MDAIVLLLIVVLLFVFNMLPWILALMSKKAAGTQKFIWFLAAFFLSWLGFLVYYFLVVKPEWIAEQEQRNPQRVRRDENGMPINV